MSNGEILIDSGIGLILTIGIVYLYIRFSHPRDYVNVLKKRHY